VELGAGGQEEAQGSARLAHVEHPKRSVVNTDFGDSGAF